MLGTGLFYVTGKKIQEPRTKEAQKLYTCFARSAFIK